MHHPSLCLQLGLHLLGTEGGEHGGVAHAGPPIDPSPVIHRRIHLPLRRVVLNSWHVIGGSGHGICDLQYLYGSFPHGLTALAAERFTMRPWFVDVIEYPRRRSIGQPFEEQDLVHMRLPQSPTIIGPAQSGPWTYQATVPHHNLSVEVMVDGPRAGVEELGRRVLQVLERAPRRPAQQKDGQNFCGDVP